MKLSKLSKYKYLILRRFTQCAILAIFILGNYSIATIKNVQNMDSVGVFSGNIEHLIGDSSSVVAKEASFTSWFAQGNLSHSRWFGGAFSLSDPLSVMQIFLAGGGLAFDIVLGALLVIIIYGVFLGRAYCAFVCPINLITDLAHFLRAKLGLNTAQRKFFLSRYTRFVILALVLVLSFIFGVGAFEILSPISMAHRGIVFGMGFGIFALLAIFLFDLLLLKNGFCGHICPLGAMYALIGKFALLRVKHTHSRCTKCMECVRVCPEPEVLKPISKQSGALMSMACIRCGRCIEACNDDALNFGIYNFLKKESK